MEECPVGYTCGSIDDAIASLEELRRDNESLRQWGDNLYAECEGYQDEIQNLKSDIEYLNNELSKCECT